MIYLNNAATTYPKPQCVLDAHAAALCEIPSAQFRSASLDNQDVFLSCKNKLGKLFKINDTERIFFTSGATDALNAIICGLNLEEEEVITTQTEHNSVLRPLFNHRTTGNRIVISCDQNGKIDPDAVEAAITPHTKAIFLNHCSNVTGMVQDAKKIGEITKNKGVLFVLDASQSAGCIPIDVADWNVDLLIFTGHKSLYGVQGTGGFFVRDGINLRPYRYGGTGKDSLKLVYEGDDYEYEVGTQNTAGIAALEAGLTYITSRGIETIIKKEQAYIKMLHQALKAMENVTVYGENAKNVGPVLSFNIKGLQASDAAYILNSGYEIVVRTGFHCAPLIHEALGSRSFGTVRVSVSDLTKEEEIYTFLDAVRQIQQAL